MDQTFRNNSLQKVPVQEGALPLPGWSMEESRKYFFQLCWSISLPLICLIGAFLPLWLMYIRTFGTDHLAVLLFEMCMNFSLWGFILFMVAYSLFNKTHPPKQSLKFWPFIFRMSWPLLIEGLKAICYIFCGLLLFIVPGIIKQIRFTFLPYVILFNRSYHEGKLKALPHSDQLSRGLAWILFFLFVCVPTFLYEGVRFIIKRYFHRSEIVEYGFFQYTGLILSVYIGGVLMIYLFSVLYFMYVAKDQKHMIDSNV